jgi:hypothetical protein
VARRWTSSTQPAPFFEKRSWPLWNVLVAGADPTGGREQMVLRKPDDRAYGRVPMLGYFVIFILIPWIGHGFCPDPEKLN